ncbi:tetratricopeptide repeat protein [Alishewanella jeotgali]|uniref:Uncharacterized protein n=1 Tax=Alishewanella jeotgali KCTC 22429 TaxID=1129374 RepID=H3ZB95_9ALTE|nr:tetratricopeptide repeat protein [Alishewanella jeotgali]EHR42209.1 hypothetical protein AJE_03001 [Alishewanella jeotgali KCTC 22429]
MFKSIAFVLGTFFPFYGAYASFTEQCEPLTINKNGPPFSYHDYSAQARERLRLAEGAHFTQSVRSGISGNSGSLIGDLHFVLTVFPNHPHALAIMADVQQRPGFSRQHPLRRDYYYPTTNCYFQRALQIAPTDAGVHLVMAIHLHKQKQYQQAKTSYLNAIQLKPNAAEAHYNLGLLLNTMNELDDALKHAHIAYSLGYPLPGLRNLLKQRGVWREPEQENSTDNKGSTKYFETLSLQWS